MGLFEWGINQIDKADANLQRFGQKFGIMPLSWRQVVMRDKSRDGLMWRIPDPVVPMASSLSSVQVILVAEYENVIVLRDGAIGQQILLPPGLYDIRRTLQLRGQIEVIWFTTREFQLRWGVPGIMTKDRVRIGASGHYNVAITNPEMFMRNVAGNEQVYKDEQLLNFARASVSNIVADLMSRKTVMEFQQSRPEFQMACQEALMPQFGRWGLEFRGLTVDADNIPEEYLERAQKLTFVTLDKEAEIEGARADVTLEQLKAQKEQYAMLVEAERIRLLGNAHADTMRGQVGIGLDPVELQKIDAIKILAEHPAPGALVDNRPQIINQLMPPSAPPTTGPVIVTGMPFLPTQQPAILPAPSASGGPMSREKIEEMLDKLDERFIDGEITEQVYLDLQAKLQKRLEKLS